MESKNEPEDRKNSPEKGIVIQEVFAMKKTMIDGESYVKLKDLRYAIRHLRRMIPANYRNFDEDHRALVHLAYGDITKALYRDELKEAHTPEEIRKVLEMPGSWQVVKIIGKCEYLYFEEWSNGMAVVQKNGGGMVFTYRSKAEEIAEKLGEGWKVIDVSEEAMEASKRLLNAIFGED